MICNVCGGSYKQSEVCPFCLCGPKEKERYRFFGQLEDIYNGDLPGKIFMTDTHLIFTIDHQMIAMNKPSNYVSIWFMVGNQIKAAKENKIPQGPIIRLSYQDIVSVSEGKKKALSISRPYSLTAVDGTVYVLKMEKGKAFYTAIQSLMETATNK